VSGKIRYTVWLNSQSLGAVLGDPIAEETSLDYVSVSAGAGSSWFDDIALYNP
jgi:hypothetical protein